MNKAYTSNNLIKTEYENPIIPKKDFCINKICKYHRKEKAKLIHYDLYRGVVSGFYKCNKCEMVYKKSYSKRRNKPFPKIHSFGPLFIKKIKELVNGHLGVSKMSQILGLYEQDFLLTVGYLQIETASTSAYKEENKHEISTRYNLEQKLFNSRHLNLKELIVKNKACLKRTKKRDPEYFNYLVLEAKSLQSRRTLSWNKYICYLKLTLFYPDHFSHRHGFYL